MKIVLITCGILLMSFLALLSWFGYPWSLGEKIIKGDVVHVEPAGIVDNEEFPSVVKIQTWNLSFLFGEGSEGPGYQPKDKKYFEDKLNQLVQEVKKSSPDIICLQEIDFESNRTLNIDQARYLAARASYPYVAEVVSWQANYIPFPYWPVSRHFGRMKSGGAILSKYPIVSHDIHLFKKPLSQPWWYNIFYLHRYFQTVIVELGEKKLKLANLHLEAFDKQDRRGQIEILLKKVKEEKIQVVAGDFNMVPSSAVKKSKFNNSQDDYENDQSFDLMMKSGLMEVIPESIYSQEESRYFTFPASRPDRRLDYIFYDQGLKMIKAEVLPSALSDHLPLQASIQIGNPVFNPY